MTPEEINKHWVGMPEFNQENKAAFKTVSISFENEDDLELFNKNTGLKITKKTKGVFYPAKKLEKVIYVSED